MQEKENILDILEKARTALAEKDTFVLNQLSNRTIHTASIFNDSDSIAIAVIVYALSKILEREKYASYAGWPDFFKTCVNEIDSAIKSVKKNDTETFRQSIANIRTAISKLSGHLKQYIEEVFRKASINKASRIYEHGISLQQTADLLGVTSFELAEYSGSTGIADVDLSLTKPLKSRIKEAEQLFK